MRDIFLTADLHLDHKNILKYEHDLRPFDRVQDMNEHIVQRWNSWVQPGDRTYVLGDVSFSREALELIFPRLNGRKILVMGNHDFYSVERYRRFFAKVVGAYEIDRYLLTHYPVHTECLGFGHKGNSEPRYIANIHGHTHSHSIQDSRYYCVSVEQHDFLPVAFDDIKAIYDDSN